MDSEAFGFDAFVSYSRKDSEIARRLEDTLERYRPPRGLGLPSRHLRIFRDEADFTGTEYGASLKKNLQASATMLLLCSPASRQSPYVDGEIAQFAECRGAERIVPVLVGGLANNEAAADEASKAFPDRLVSLLPVPLAADFRGFDPAKDKIDRGRFQPAWYKLLADLFQDYGIDRARLEEREQRRQARRRAIMVTVTAAVMLALAGLAAWAMVERAVAIRHAEAAKRQSQIALSRALASQADALITDRSTQPELSVLLAVESVRRAPSGEAQRVLRKASAIVPPRVWARRHNGRVRSVAFTSDGRHVISAGEDATVRLWDVADGREAGRWTMAGAVRAVMPSADGSLLAIGGADGRVLLVERATGRTRWTVECGEPVVQLSFSDDGMHLMAASRRDISVHQRFDLTVRRIDVAGGTTTIVARRPDGAGLTAGGRYVVTASGWAPLGAGGGGGQLEGLGHEFGDSIHVAVMDDRAGRVAIGTRAYDPYLTGTTGTVRLVDTRNRKELFARKYSDGISALAFDAGAGLIVMGGSDGTARVMASDNGQEIWRVGHAGPVHSVALAPGARVFATGGDEGDVRLYRLGGEAWEIVEPSGYVASALGDHGRRFAALSGPNGVLLTVWSVGGPQLSETKLSPDQRMPPHPLAFIRDGTQVLIGDNSATVEFRDAATGERRRAVSERTQNPIVLVAAVPDGNLTAIGTWDERIRVLTTATGTERWQATLRKQASALAFSPDGKWLLAGSERQVLVLAADDGRRQAAFEYPGVVTALAASPDARLVAVGGQDRTVRIFEMAGGQVSATVPLASAPEDVAFTSGAEALVVARRATGRLIVERHDLQPEVVIRNACQRLTRNLAPLEWQEFLVGEPYRPTCPPS